MNFRITTKESKSASSATADNIPVGRVEVFLQGARAEADELDPVLKRWSGYVSDFAWQSIDTSLRPAVMTGRWNDAVKHLQVFRRNLR